MWLSSLAQNELECKPREAEHNVKQLYYMSNVTYKEDIPLSSTRKSCLTYVLWAVNAAVQTRTADISLRGHWESITC